MTSDPKPSRFVILLHEVAPALTRTEAAHFDWMFEINGTLRTWATPPLANMQQWDEQTCDRLPDHRLAYLDYEGEIGGNRGHVSRVLAGHFRVREDRDDRFIADLAWEDPSGHRQAQVTICPYGPDNPSSPDNPSGQADPSLPDYRSRPGEDLRVEDSRGVLLLRFSPG